MREPPGRRERGEVGAQARRGFARPAAREFGALAAQRHGDARAPQRFEHERAGAHLAAQRAAQAREQVGRFGSGGGRVCVRGRVRLCRGGLRRVIRFRRRRRV
jgi:hypothetical protein